MLFLKTNKNNKLVIKVNNNNGYIKIGTINVFIILDYAYKGILYAVGLFLDKVVL